MRFSLRPALMAGVAVVSVGTLAFTSVVTPLPAAAAAHPGPAVQSQVVVDLQAARQPFVDGGSVSPFSSLSAAQVLDIATALNTAAVTPTIAPIPPLVNLADFIDAAYLFIEPWVAYGVEVAAYVAAWIIPYVGWIVIQQADVVYNFVESLIHSGVFNATDWLRGDGSVLKNVADWIVDLGLAFVWLGIDEIDSWIPLPPLPIPRPPYADLEEGQFGDFLVNTSHAIAQVSNAIWNIWEPIKGGVDRGVASISSVLDSLAWVPFVPLLNFELNATWDLIASEGDAITGFAHDLINAGNQFVIDTVEGGGLVAATITALQTTLASISTRGGEAIGALVDWGRAQIDFVVDVVTPGAEAGLVAPAGVTPTLADGDSGPAADDEAPARAVTADRKQDGESTVDTTAVDDGARDDADENESPLADTDDAADQDSRDSTAEAAGTDDEAKGDGDEDSAAAVDKPGPDRQKPADKGNADNENSEGRGRKAGDE